VRRATEQQARPRRHPPRSRHRRSRPCLRGYVAREHPATRVTQLIVATPKCPPGGHRDSPRAFTLRGGHECSIADPARSAARRWSKTQQLAGAMMRYRISRRRSNTSHDLWRKAKCCGPGLSGGSGGDFDRSMCGAERCWSWPFWLRDLCACPACFRALR
jgi:hypothetical protein